MRPVSTTLERRCILRLEDLGLFKCFLPHCERLSLPPAVMRKRLSDPLWVFIFGISDPVRASRWDAAKPPHQTKRPLEDTRGPTQVHCPLADRYYSKRPRGVQRPKSQLKVKSSKLKAGTLNFGLSTFNSFLARRQHRRHAFAFHARVFFHLGQVAELFQDHLHDPLALLDVLHLAAFEQHVDKDLVLVLEELAGLVDFGFDVVIAGLGAEADFLQLLMMRFGLVFGLLLLQELELAEVHDLADGRALGGGDLDEIEACFPRHLQRLGGRNDADLFTLGPNQAHGADADLFVDPLMVAAVVWSKAIGSRRRQERVLLSLEPDPCRSYLAEA